MQSLLKQLPLPEDRPDHSGVPKSNSLSPPLKAISSMTVITDDGYYLAQDRTDYSVAVVPVMWPETLNPGINTTGAGDICSGVSLIYSGWSDSQGT